MQRLFTGYYEATLIGDRQVVLTIREDLSFEYVEDSYRRGQVRQVYRNGVIRATSTKTAKAGMVQLEWLAPQTIRALSPYGSNIRPQVGMSGGRGGMIWSYDSHVFFLQKR